MGKRIIVLLALTVWLAALPAGAMKFQDGSVDAVKVDAGDHFIDTWQSYWALSGDRLTWIDMRLGYENSQIFGLLLTDPLYQESPVDPLTASFDELDMDLPLAVYSYEDGEGNPIIRIAEIADESVQTWDYPAPDGWLYNLSVSGRCLSFINDGDYYRLYLSDLSDPADPNTRVIADFTGTGEYIYDTALDANVLAWSGETYDSLAEVYVGFLCVADISDPNNPQITQVFLPVNENEPWNYNYFEYVDISGEWMAASGVLDGVWGIYAIRNFTDPDIHNWQVIRLGLPCGAGMGGEPVEPRIDGNIVVWQLSGQSYLPTSCGDCSEVRSASAAIDRSRSKIMGALLLDSGHAVTSILAAGMEEEWFHGVDISGMNVVWSGYYWDNDLQADIMTYSKGVLELECGDRGYLYGDLNRDCRVDLVDVSLLAAGWLNCSLPGDTGCRDGDLFVDRF